jgi:hypothetical protein
MTERARARACRRVGRDGHSVAAVARDFGVGWHTIMRAVVDHGTPLVDHPARTAGVRALGVDETSFLRAAPRAAGPLSLPGWSTWGAPPARRRRRTGGKRGDQVVDRAGRRLAVAGRASRSRPVPRLLQRLGRWAGRPRGRGGRVPRGAARQRHGRRRPPPRATSHPRAPRPAKATGCTASAGCCSRAPSGCPSAAAST